MKRSLWGAALAFVAAPVISACDEGCTDIGCNSGVQLIFSPNISEPGLYRFSVERSNQDGSCEISVPVDASAVVCDPFILNLGGDGSISGLKTLATSSLSLVVQRNGALLQHTELQPEFDVSEPNGPDCGVCSTAMEVITLP
jgi:hypothetical protein